MKTITMPVYRRPQYMRRALEAIKTCDPKDYVLFVGVEPGCPETSKMASEISFMRRVIINNKKILGVAGNAKSLLDTVFSWGSSFNVHVEEDVVVTPDALALADWYSSIQDRYAVLGLVNYFSNPDRPIDVLDTHYFAPIGWCIKRTMWESLIGPEWLNDSRGYDFSIANTIDRTKTRTLHPMLSRSTHIGRDGGVHCSKEYHDKTFGNLALSTGTHRSGFRIVKS